MTASFDRVRSLMDEAGMKQVDLARVIGVSESTVSRMLEGSGRDLTLGEARALVEEFRSRIGRRKDLTLDALFASTPLKKAS